MAEHAKLRVRRSIADLQTEYRAGDKKPLEDLMRAWRGIKALPPTDPNSFFVIGGYHGEPFRGAGWGNAAWWGGYCNHGNVLFPTWHRVYVLRLEDALRSIPGCEAVTQPFWDEASDESVAGGVPWALTDEFFELDGVQIPNPLRSFAFTKGIVDNVNGDDPNYSKPKGYETVRYPLSGLVGTAADQAATAAHNAKYANYATNVGLLNTNVINWLTSSITVDGQVIPTHVKDKYERCLNAPNYTVFSNTTSAAQWNEDNDASPVTPLGVAAQQHPPGGRRLRRAQRAERGRRFADRRRQRRHGRERHRRARPDLLLPPLLRRSDVLALAAAQRLHRPSRRDRGLPGNQFGRQPGPDAGRGGRDLAFARLCARAVQEAGRQDLYLARLHQQRAPARGRLRARLARGASRRSISASQVRQGGRGLQPEPGAHPRLVPGLGLSSTRTASGFTSAPKRCSAAGASRAAPTARRTWR